MLDAICFGDVTEISGVAVHQKTQVSRTVGLCKLYDIRDMVDERKEQRKVQVPISEPVY